jgi:hypothetical protein
MASSGRSFVPTANVEEAPMKTLITSAVVAGIVALLPSPRPADAMEKFDKCLFEAIESCDRDFKGWDPYMTAARGYCYIIRTGMCYAMDPAE